MRDWKFNHIDFSVYPFYEQNDLGVFWTPEKTFVKIWAPSAKMVEFRLYLLLRLIVTNHNKI